mmetsp:Transcript_24561/g.36038  ORF Transcript_24561/g.36038 Transcript_24561/m.36038 type:complete len:409 (-) Transcript_24561:108-1334(-)|eukprot:CAMPEP_0195519610 /NCGR_PEP_ID=MMETSP0794_2-20130614/15129_1 /TAXON_ID=515487 /ORGANISM="Stephanopyxis turris, Strain CCMP 815" /LENGTH=408 /DNA_ID=CAMNT_0040648793 /DNA_START=65 /DNA_END=1291 /DNA_ORIENTATION=-
MVDIKIPPITKDAAKDFHGKIVIIGAGVAGLFAANTLKYMGIDDYVVLEASDRYGGRLKSNDDLHTEVPLDVGAEWIHASDERMVKDMLVFPHDESKDLLPSDFIKYQPEWVLGVKNKKSKLLQKMYQETKFKRSTWWHWLDTHVYRHVQEKVKLNSPVKGIIYGAKTDEEGATGKVKIVCEDDTEYMADKVICTIPLAVLKKGDGMIKFDPPLPETKRKSIDAIDMPPGCRILFDMKSNFYPDLTVPHGLLSTVWNLGDLTCIYDALYGKDQLSSSSGKAQNILAFVVIGHKNAEALGRLQGEDDEIAKAALAKLDQIFDGQATQNYISHVVQNWTREPYILGAYSFPGSFSELIISSCGRHRRALGATVQDQILFAGEHTSVEYFSLVPGAALEGRRAAVEAVSGV